MAASESSSKPWAKLIGNRCPESLFFVMVEPKDSECKNIQEVTEKKKILPRTKAKKRSCETSFCTGFVVEEKGNQVKILTSAHCIEHVFTAKDPISRQDAEKFFRFIILCDHYEKAFRESRTTKDRCYSSASVAAIDCAKDLLLLQIDGKDILDFSGDTCQEPHQALLPSQSLLGSLDSAAMISWPPCRPRTSAAGEISHISRGYADISDKNPHGYDMNLLEVNVPGQQGSSGAPLLDENGHYLGMLHGGGMNCFSCFICLADILQFLLTSGVQNPSSSTDGQGGCAGGGLEKADS